MVLQVGQEDLALRPGSPLALSRVLDNADYCQPRGTLPRIVHSDALADWVLARPVSVGQSLVDHDDAGTVHRVTLAYVAAAREGNHHRFEAARPDHAIDGVRAFTPVRHRLAL